MIISEHEEHGCGITIYRFKSNNFLCRNVYSKQVEFILIDESTSLCRYLQEGESALMLASQEGYTEIVKCLINAKAKIDLQSKASIFGKKKRYLQLWKQIVCHYSETKFVCFVFCSWFVLFCFLFLFLFFVFFVLYFKFFNKRT